MHLGCLALGGPGHMWHVFQVSALTDSLVSLGCSYSWIFTVIVYDCTFFMFIIPVVKSTRRIICFQVLAILLWSLAWCWYVQCLLFAYIGAFETRNPFLLWLYNIPSDLIFRVLYLQTSPLMDSHSFSSSCWPCPLKDFQILIKSILSCHDYKFQLLTEKGIL